MASERRTDFAQRLLGGKKDPAYRVNVLSGQPDTKSVGGGKAFVSPPPVRRPESGVKVIESACFSCQTCCEVLIFVEEASGKILRVEGNPASPITRGVLCSKGLAAKDLVYNPARLRYPLRRVGARGEGRWERISWDEALSTTAEKLLANKAKYGPQGVAFLQGTQRGWVGVFSRFANAFGAVNQGAPGWAQCLWPRSADNAVTFGAGYMECADYERTKCLIVWGVNPPVNWAVKAADIMDARERGVPVIVVDPHLSETAAKADLWLQLLPGTDTALALAMLHVIIGNDWIDHDFVANWTVGFEALRRHVAEYTPQWGEAVTRVPAGLITLAAELYAKTKPAAITRCLALDEVADSVQACRATALLAAVTGNIGIPGGNVDVSKRGEINQHTSSFAGNHWLGPELESLRIGYEEFPLLCGKLASVPYAPVPGAHMPGLWETIATGKPYPVKAAVIFGSNAVVSYSNPGRVREAMKELDFIVVADLFLTPTAEQADIVLPASSWLERDNIISSFQASYTYTYLEQKAVQLPQARSDVEIIIELANRLGIGEHFWRDPEDFYDTVLAPTGLTLAGLKKAGRLYAPQQFPQYAKNGFATPSGKVELYSSILERLNCAPLPAYSDSQPVPTAQYPYILTTGGRVSVFRHTENRENPLLREICPRPPVFIHPRTAAAHGIGDGEAMLIETATGSALGYARYTQGLQPDVIQASPNWWGEENINEVIPWGRYAEGIGSVCQRGLLCRIRRVEAGESPLAASEVR